SGEHRREEPPARGDAQGPEDPARRDAPGKTEQQILDRPVPSLLHHDPGPPATQQPDAHPRDAHCELHDPPSFSGGDEHWPPPLLLASRLTSLQGYHIKYMSHRSYIRLNSAVSRASREVGGRRAVTVSRGAPMRNVTRALVGAIVASLVAAAVSVYAETPAAAAFAAALGRRAVTVSRGAPMRNVTRALVGAIVASLVAGAVSVYAETPTAADFAACNTDARAASKSSG